MIAIRVFVLFVKRFPFLDWMRGLAIVVMIQCHTFNSMVRMDLRDGGGYVFSQFVGGMAAPLFLFMAGMTLAFQMESLERREPRAMRRWLTALRRGGYILAIAFLFRITNWMGSWPNGNLQEITKVDILNCMGVGMGVLAFVAAFESSKRARAAAVFGFAVAGLAPILANLSWDGVPPLLREYLVPLPGRGHFPFFPCASYLGFGLACGTIVKRTAMERFERLMQWSVLIGFGLILGAEYLANVPYSIYAKSNFWTDNPTLILIRVGIILLALAASYVWTEYCAAPRWSWMQCLGKNSLMVYWVHVMLVYGALARPLKRTMNAWQAALATMFVAALMVALSAAWQRRKAVRAERWRAATTVARGAALA